MARTPDPSLYALWRERVRCQADSGLTVAQFYTRERLSVASFSAWKRRLRLINFANRRPALPAPPAFLPITVRVVEHASDTPLLIEADLPNGICLRIPTANLRLAGHLVCVIARAGTDSGGS